MRRDIELGTAISRQGAKYGAKYGHPVSCRARELGWQAGEDRRESSQDIDVHELKRHFPSLLRSSSHLQRQKG